MSSTRYIEFDSTYRDRKLYPLASDFVVEMAQSGQSDKISSRDPVSDASPILIWNTNFISGIGYSNVITSLQINTYSAPNTSQGNNVYMLYSATGQLRQVKNFYVGACIQRDRTGASPIPGPLSAPGTTARILEYNPINLNYGLVTLDTTNISSGLTGYFIYDPTPISTTTANSEIKIFIPGSNRNLSQNQKTEHFGLGGDNYYVGYYLQNTDTGEAVKIKSFDSLTRLATLETNTVGEWYNGAVGKNFAIRKTLPIERGQINTVVSTSEFIIPVPSNSDQVGNFLRLLPLTSGPTTQYSPYTPPYTEERRIQIYEQISLTTARIKVFPPFSALSVNDDYFEIEQFSRDNYNPFIYTGSLVSSQETVCYEVELLNLILPNALLISGRGGRPIFYPYIYVELQQVSSAGSTSKNIIYSNNPNSGKMLFRAVVDDTPIPVISPFIKIDGDGMIHVIKFKPNDTFRFAVFHSNGESFETSYSEQFSPTTPNPLTQISACFAFKRV